MPCFWVYISFLFYTALLLFISMFCFSDVDTDEIENDSKNVEEEVIEFFIKEEVTVID